MTDEKRELLGQVIAFVRLRRVSRRASAAEALAALELEMLFGEMIGTDPAAGQKPAPQREEVAA